MQVPSHIRSELLDVCSRLYAKEFVAGTDGNVSMRLDTGSFLCTPTARNKGDIGPEDLVVIDNSGRIVEGRSKPSTEIQMHLAYYHARPDVMAVVHAHPPYCTGFATTGQGLTGCVLPEIIVSLGAIPLARYATPSTLDVPASIAEYLPNHDVILLQNHGVVAAGTSVLDAYYALEKTEHAAHILFIARALGGEQKLSETQVEQLREIAGSSYEIDAASKPACEPAQITYGTGNESFQNSLEIREHIRRVINDLGL